MKTRYLLGLDIGTYSSKGVIVTENGQVIASCAVEHTLEIPHPGWAEHDAEETWWHDFLTLTRQLLGSTAIDPRDLVGVGFSAISPAILPIDGEGNALRKAILYGVDIRATREIAELQQVVDSDAELSRSGVRLSSQSAAPKVLWIRHNEPEVWARTRQVVTGTGFLLHRLTGQNTLSTYDASSFAPFFDLERCEWRAEAEEYVAPLELLPRLTWACDIAGRVSAEGAQRSGLAEGTPIITGAADAAAEAISAGLSQVGDMMVMYGSTIFFILRTEGLCKAPHFWTAPFLEQGTFALAGGMSTAGSLTRWFRDQFGMPEVEAEKAGGENAYAALAQLAGQSPPGANGIVILPYFSGERTPILDPDAKGLIFGLMLSHTRGDVYRAVLESIAFGIRHNIEVMKEEGAEPRRILAVGGGTFNSLWMQIVSDVADIEQHIPDQQIGASYGDAFLAAVGVGVASGFSDVDRWVHIKQIVKPHSEMHQKYADYYAIYRDLYKQNGGLMRRLGAAAHGS